MASNFNALLSKPMDEIKRPLPLPAGTYHGVIGKHAFDESRQRKTAFVKYELTGISAGEDISEEQMEGIDLSKRNLSATYYLTEDALYRLKAMLESVGVPTEGRSLGECIAEAVGARVLINVTQRNSEDGKDIFNDVGTVVGEQD